MRIAGLSLLAFSCMARNIASAQLDKNTFVIEAYNCSCTGDTITQGRNSVQLGVRLDKSTVIHTAWGTINGCRELYLNADGQRYPMRVMSINVQDGLARLEPQNIASNAMRVEELWRNAPSYIPAGKEDLDEGKPNIVVLQGPRRTRQARALANKQVSESRSGRQVLYQFDLPIKRGPSEDMDQLTGGPVWFAGKEERLLGIITKVEERKERYHVTCVPMGNALNDRLFSPWYGLADAMGPSTTGCKARGAYWNRIEDYLFRVIPTPDYLLIKQTDDWLPALRESLLRIRAHVVDSLANKGNPEKRICAHVNDLENAALNLKVKSENPESKIDKAKTEKDNLYRVLAIFIKHYSDVHCKNRKAGTKQFDKQVDILNASIELITDTELDLLLECGLPLSVVENFTREQYALKNMAVFAKRSMVELANEEKMADPCHVKGMLEDIEQWIAVGQLISVVREQPAYEDILKLEPLVRDARAASLQKYTVKLESRSPSLSEVLEIVSKDSCLSSSEGQEIIAHFQAKADERSRADVAHGAQLITEVRAALEKAYGKENLTHVEMKLFPAENGVGVSVSVLGGGSRSRTSSGNSSGTADTTSLYRKGFPLGALGDDIANNIARELWSRVCKEHDRDSSNYTPVEVRILGMADGNPVRQRISMPDECKAELDRLRYNDLNKELAYARAWTLGRAMQWTDECGLMEQVGPRLVPVTFAEKGGPYRGVGIHLVMRRQ
jgi:hypothetical protein